MGPQLGYYYPEIVQQIDLHGPGIEAQGAAVPGLAMYILIGRTKDYAWSLTSAGHDVRDVFAEQLCNPDGSAPTRASDHYRSRAQCRPFEEFNAGTLNGTPLRYHDSVHGPVIGTATVDGKPYALSRKRSTFGRDGLNLGALKDMTEGKATTPRAVLERGQPVRLHVQLGLRLAQGHRLLLARAACPGGRAASTAGCRRSAPASTSGAASCASDEHPHDVGGPGGLLLNWNNRSAPGFMHGDDEPYGSVHRVELFDRFPRSVAAPRRRRAS